MIGILGTFTAIIFGHGNLSIAIYGARILLLHFPLFFVIGKIFSREDVIKMGKVVVFISIPMAILVIVQFYSPQSAWVNRGIGGDMEGAGFGGALGFYRAPATFSFTNGTHNFFGFAACFIFYFWLNHENINRLILIASTVCLILVIPFSISRSLMFHVIVSLTFAILALLKRPKYLAQLLLAISTCIFSLSFLSNSDFLQTAIQAFTYRFEDASSQEGGLEGTLGDRFLGGLISALFESSEQPFFGYGLGIGSNVANKMLSGGRGFLLAEEEWARLIGELGPLLGLGFIILRLRLIGNIGYQCYKKLQQEDVLPWMLLSYGCLMVAQGQTAQPTSLGFCTLIGGLMIASLHTPQDPSKNLCSNRT